MKNLQTFVEFINESNTFESDETNIDKNDEAVLERRVSFKGKIANDLYKIIKDEKFAEVFAKGNHYSVDRDDLRNDLKNDYIIGLDPDGEEFDIKVTDIEFITLF